MRYLCSCFTVTPQTLRRIWHWIPCSSPQIILCRLNLFGVRSVFLRFAARARALGRLRASRGAPLQFFGARPGGWLFLECLFRSEYSNSLSCIGIGFDAARLGACSCENLFGPVPLYQRFALAVLLSIVIRLVQNVWFGDVADFWFPR